MKDGKILEMIKSSDKEMSVLGIMLLAERDIEDIKTFVIKHGDRPFERVATLSEDWEFTVMVGISLNWRVIEHIYFSLGQARYLTTGNSLNLFHFKKGRERLPSSGQIIEIKKQNI